MRFRLALGCAPFDCGLRLVSLLIYD
jgi:hypothetical protein